MYVTDHLPNSAIASLLRDSLVQSVQIIHHIIHLLSFFKTSLYLGNISFIYSSKQAAIFSCKEWKSNKSIESLNIYV